MTGPSFHDSSAMLLAQHIQPSIWEIIGSIPGSSTYFFIDSVYEIFSTGYGHSLSAGKLSVTGEKNVH